ncbi:GFA family protein [Sphingomonas xanthus]|uniref:GFA family protein n=1 Tax=Sphingomonas xanthus TaxID=2594473 RepID=A0A516IUH0_9SPHN|nr:GFA family protein [Sphingomonas xanthus]
MEISGGCHCGAVRFRARVPDPPLPALNCNCSVCSMTGFLHIIVPHADFTLSSGEQSLTGYSFGTGAANHLFCATCGVKSFYQPRSHPGAWSVNAHCLDSPPALEIAQFDGRNWDRAKAALDDSHGAG